MQKLKIVEHRGHLLPNKKKKDISAVYGMGYDI